jgi:hypothetical protein
MACQPTRVSRSVDLVSVAGQRQFRYLSNCVAVVCENRGMTAAVSILDREMYAEAEAARLLRVPQQTLNYWLEGKTWRGRTQPPVIRIEPTGQRTVTWAEFVEAGLPRQCRRTHRTSGALVDHEDDRRLLPGCGSGLEIGS